jgi:2'-5' RNA ligase
MIRLFVAIDFPEEVRKLLSGMCCGIPGAKWIPEEQFHLTLRFIGEVDGGLFRDIMDTLADVRSASMSIRLRGLGYFPPRKQPRVLWVGIEPASEVSLLRDRIESKLVRLGLEPERRKFSPHVTLARLDDPPLPKLTRYLAGNALFASDTFEVNEFSLYSSVLTPKGAIHQIEAAYPLEKKD